MTDNILHLYAAGTRVWAVRRYINGGDRKDDTEFTKETGNEGEVKTSSHPLGNVKTVK